MASTGKFALLQNVNHKGQTKKKKKKVGVDDRTPLNDALRKALNNENAGATGKSTEKNKTATAAQKIKPKITKHSPTDSYEHSLHDETQQWEEWKKKDEEVAASIFQSELEQAIALSRSDYQEKLDLQLNAWVEEAKQRKSSQLEKQKCDMKLKNGIQKHLHVQNCVESSVAIIKQEVKKINKPSQIEKKQLAPVKQTQPQPPQQANEKVKVEENSKPIKKSETVKQTQPSLRDDDETIKCDSVPQLTKAQKKRLRKKSKSEKNCSVVAENSQTEMNAIIGSMASKSERNSEDIQLTTLTMVQRVSGIATDESLQHDTLNPVLFADLPLSKSPIKSQVDPSESELVLQLKNELESKDCEIAGYSRQLQKYMRDVDNLKKGNDLLCRILAEKHMKQKEALLDKIGELTSVNEYLTKDIQGLHVLLEKERSKSEMLQQRLGEQVIIPFNNSS